MSMSHNEAKIFPQSIFDFNIFAIISDPDKIKVQKNISKCFRDYKIRIYYTLTPQSTTGRFTS